MPGKLAGVKMRSLLNLHYLNFIVFILAIIERNTNRTASHAKNHQRHLSEWADSASDATVRC